MGVLSPHDWWNGCTNTENQEYAPLVEDEMILGYTLKDFKHKDVDKNINNTELHSELHLAPVFLIMSGRKSQCVLICF